MVRGLDVPLLVVHDRDDRMVPWTHGAAIAEAATHGQIFSTTGLGHKGIKNEPEVVRHVVDFLTATAGSTEAAAPPLEHERVE